MMPKYRAWDEQTKDMVYPSDGFTFTSADILKWYSIVMQCTGAKDMHGEDIYEGDIVRKEECSPDDVAFGYYGSTGTVKYNPELTAFVIDGDGVFSDACPMKYSFDSIEVIGNVYENPELLE
jgi:uncharacterized phage protein (TIGR01671 family)